MELQDSKLRPIALGLGCCPAGAMGSMAPKPRSDTFPESHRGGPLPPIVAQVDRLRSLKPNAMAATPFSVLIQFGSASLVC